MQARGARWVSWNMDTGAPGSVTDATVAKAQRWDHWWMLQVERLDNCQPVELPMFHGVNATAVWSGTTGELWRP